MISFQSSFPLSLPHQYDFYSIKTIRQFQWPHEKGPKKKLPFQTNEKQKTLNLNNEKSLRIRIKTLNIHHIYLNNKKKKKIRAKFK